jgi:hypothetical protein
MTKASSFIIKLYFAVISAITLFTLMFGLIDFLSLGLKTYVFKAADVPTYTRTCGDIATFAEIKPTDGSTPTYTREQQLADCERGKADDLQNYKNQKANDAVRDFALILVSLPLFLIHFRFVYRDWKEDRA